MKKPKHSPMGASSFTKVVACPASVTLSEGQVVLKNVYSIKGSELHDNAEKALRKEIEDDQIKPEVQVYVHYCRALMAESDQWGVETKIEIPKLGDLAYGTVDFWAWNKTSKTLTVVDLKTGRAPVSPTSTQLVYYSLGLWRYIKEVPAVTNGVIVQQGKIKEGRITHRQVKYFINQYKITLGEVEEFKKTRDERLIRRGNHCFFCAAKPVCPKWQKEDE